MNGLGNVSNISSSSDSRNKNTESHRSYTVVGRENLTNRKIAIQ